MREGGRVKEDRKVGRREEGREKRTRKAKRRVEVGRDIGLDIQYA